MIKGCWHPASHKRQLFSKDDYNWQQIPGEAGVPDRYPDPGQLEISPARKWNNYSQLRPSGQLLARLCGNVEGWVSKLVFLTLPVMPPCSDGFPDLPTRNKPGG